MKYLIKNQVINADHIVRVQYLPADETTDDKSACFIATDEPSEEMSLWPIVLSDTDADRFWEIYIRDAYQVVTK